MRITGKAAGMRRTRTTTRSAPKLEKAITIGGFLIGAVIVVILIIVIAT